MRRINAGLLAVSALAALPLAGCSPAAESETTAEVAVCDKVCLETMALQYRTAYLAHTPDKAGLSEDAVFVENHIPLKFPDGTWDTVTEEVGPALTVSDPVTGQVATFTTIMQNDTPGFLAIRLKIEDRKITEAEHIISTRRNLSSPPTPIGDVEGYEHDPQIAQPVPADLRSTRDAIIAQGNAYFSTLENNNGELREGVSFTPETTRYENGMRFGEVEKGFLSGRYQFNERVRDRDFFLVDEVRGIVVARGFIDHKGRLDTIRLTDGTEAKSIFREPQSWGFMEMFKVVDGTITAIEAIFVQTPYYQRSPFTEEPEMRPGGTDQQAPPREPTEPAEGNPPLPDDA